MSSQGTAEKDSTPRLTSPADYRVVAVEPLEHLRLAVRFADGLAGEVIIRQSHLQGVFQALSDPALFGKVSCAQGFVEWPGEIDLAPDAMYDEIRAHGQWILN
jgi:Protein of unknown function (DUF2442)